MAPGAAAVSEAAPTSAPTFDVDNTPVPPCVNGNCEPRDVSDFDLFRNGWHPSAPSSVEEVLEQGLELSGASSVHVAFRGIAQSDKVRCGWRGVARTLEQREESIRYWLGMDQDEILPSPAEVERQFMESVNRKPPRNQALMEVNFMGLARGGITPEAMFMTCFVDYTVNEYLLGPTVGNPTTLTVAYDGLAEVSSYDLYRRSHADGRYDNEPLTPPGQYQSNMSEVLVGVESVLIHIMGGRESVVFLAPMGAYSAIAVEAWRAVAQWGLQEDDQGTVQAVRYGVLEGVPEQTQTLANLKSRIATAAASDDFANARIEDPSGLTQYYRDIGAYDDITPGDGSTATFTPAQPPAPYNCTNSTSVVSPNDNRGLVYDCEVLLAAKDTLRGTATLDWAATSVITGWEGITTGGTRSRVTKVLLPSESLSGSIPASLGRLFGLTKLDLSGNSLSGEIPKELGWLENLEELKLSGNEFTGCIPVALKDVPTNDLISLNLPYCHPPAPQNLRADTTTETSITLNWDPEGNASMYRLEHRNPEGAGWTVLSDTLSAAAYTVSNLDCGTKHRFRVSAHIEGTNYVTAGSDYSTAHGTLTVLCPPPVFHEKSYVFDVKEYGDFGDVVGSVAATDERGIEVVYDIVEHDVYRTFDIGRETGKIVVTASDGDLWYHAGKTIMFTVTAKAKDDRGFSSMVTVEVKVLESGS